MAMPYILQQIARNNPVVQRVKQMMGMVNGSANPQSILNSLMMTNPQMRQVMDMVNNQYGGDAEKAFRTVAEKNGINPEEIMNMLR